METIARLQSLQSFHALLGTSCLDQSNIAACIANFTNEKVILDNAPVLSQEETELLINILQSLAQEKVPFLLEKQVCAILFSLSVSFLSTQNDLNSSSLLQAKVQTFLFQIISQCNNELLSIIVPKLSAELLPFHLMLQKYSDADFDQIVDYLKRQLNLRNFANLLSAAIYLLQHECGYESYNSLSIVEIITAVGEICKDYSTCSTIHHPIVIETLCGFVTLISLHPGSSDIDKDLVTHFITDLYEFCYDFSVDKELLITLSNCCFDALSKLPSANLPKVIVTLLGNCHRHLKDDSFLSSHLKHVQKCIEHDSEVKENIATILLERIEDDPELFPIIRYLFYFEEFPIGCKKIAVELSQTNILNAKYPEISLEILRLCSSDHLFTHYFIGIIEKYLFSLELNHINFDLIGPSCEMFFSSNPKTFISLAMSALKEVVKYFTSSPSIETKELVFFKLSSFLKLNVPKDIVDLEELESVISKCWFYTFSFGFDWNKRSFKPELIEFINSLCTFSKLPFSEESFCNEIEKLYQYNEEAVPSIKTLNSYLVTLKLIEPKSYLRDVSQIYRFLIIYHSQNYLLTNMRDFSTFLYLLDEQKCNKLSVFQSVLEKIPHQCRDYYCDAYSSFVCKLFLSLVKRSVGRYEIVSKHSYELSKIVMNKFICCLGLDACILEFLMTLLSKVHEVSNLEWNESFDAKVNESFSLDVVDNAKTRNELFLRIKNLFFDFFLLNPMNFCTISHVYLILRDYNEHISSWVKRTTLEHLVKLPYEKRMFRSVADDLSFVIKVLSLSPLSLTNQSMCSLQLSPLSTLSDNCTDRNGWNASAKKNQYQNFDFQSHFSNNEISSENLFSMQSVSESSTSQLQIMSSHSLDKKSTSCSLISKYDEFVGKEIDAQLVLGHFQDSLANDRNLTWITQFIIDGYFSSSLNNSILTSQMISYLVSIKPSSITIVIKSFLDAFSRMKLDEKEIFSTPPNEYLFHGKIIPGASSIDCFKKCYSSPSLPFIIVADTLQSCIERLAFKNEQIMLLCESMCNFFCSSATYLSNNPLYLPALLRIGSLMLKINSLFNLNYLPFIEKFIACCYDCEVVDCRFSDKKSFSKERIVLEDCIAIIQVSKFDSRCKRLFKFLIDFDIFRQTLWHEPENQPNPFPFEWDFKTCREMIGVCFTEYGLPRMAMNVYLRIHLAASKVPQAKDIFHVLISHANSCPLAIKCPFLLVRMIESKIMSESLNKLVDDWATLSPVTLIGLLLKQSDSLILKYSMECLKYGYSPDIIFFYIPQIVQSLRNDPNQFVKKLILELAQRSRLFSHLIIWNMRANLSSDDMGEQADPVLGPILNELMDQIINSFTSADREFFEREFGFFEKITNISGLLKPYIRSSKTEKKQKIDHELAKIPVDTGVYLPSNPESTVVGIDYHSGRPLQSAAKAPFMATFEIQQSEQLSPIRQSAIFKVGDDCRQDVLALQMINMFKMIFDSVGLPLYLYPYRVVATAPGCGVIEVIPDAISRDIMGREYINDLYEYYLSKFGSEESFGFQQARQRFICSLAAYSVVSFVLSFKDRHNGNIMYDGLGHIIHIDFGFMLGISPGNINVEGDGFKLTSEMLRLMGGTDPNSEHFIRFKNLVVNGYLSIRPWMDEFVKIVELMISSGLPCLLKGKETIERFKQKFRPDLSEFNARKYMLGIIDKSSEYIFATLYDLYQFKTNKIPYKK